MPTAESRLILFQPWEALLSSCSCQDGAKGVAEHCPKTRGQAAVCPQRDHGFMAGAAEQAGRTCWAPPFLNRICIRYPLPSAPGWYVPGLDSSVWKGWGNYPRSRQQGGVELGLTQGTSVSITCALSVTGLGL